MYCFEDSLPPYSLNWGRVWYTDLTLNLLYEHFISLNLDSDFPSF